MFETLHPYWRWDSSKQCRRPMVSDLDSLGWKPTHIVDLKVWIHLRIDGMLRLGIGFIPVRNQASCPMKSNESNMSEYGENVLEIHKMH